jgi:lipoyl synthase
MPDASPLEAPSRASPETHQRGHDKVSRIPVKVEATTTMPRKPAWIRAKAPTGPGVMRIKRLLRETGLATVCEDAQCPNLGECSPPPGSPPRSACSRRSSGASMP